MMSKNISNKERTINYVKFQIAQLDEIIEGVGEACKSPRVYNIYVSPFVLKRNELYKELRKLTYKPNKFKKRTV